MTYHEYLIQEDYAPTTITSYLRYQRLFSEWIEAKDYQIETVSYQECLEYVKKLHKGNRSQKSIKHEVGALKIYFNYHIQTGNLSTNSFENINIRGVKRKVHHNLLSEQELEDLYFSYSTDNIEFPRCPSVAFRNKVITGLMVYQGLEVTSLKILKVEHICSEKGTVRIPSTRKANGRILELKPQQMLPLMTYLLKHREILQEKINTYDEKLLPYSNDRFVAMAQVCKQLKKINHKVINAQQIRASVITHWLSHNNIREVQYLAGHRYISSTESYVQNDLESLHEFIESLHPIT